MNTVSKYAVNKYCDNSISNRVSQNVQNLSNNGRDLIKNNESSVIDRKVNMTVETPVQKAVSGVYDKYDTSGYYSKTKYNKDLNIYIKYKVDLSNNETISQFPTEQQVNLMQVKKNIMNIYL